MSRIRMIKPDFFDDADVAELSFAARLFFQGLWTEADREGRLIGEWKRLKARIFPFDDLDVAALAAELTGKDMIRLYPSGGKYDYVWIRSFKKHQRPHVKEPASLIPPCPTEFDSRHAITPAIPVAPRQNGAGTPDTESGVRNTDTDTDPERGREKAAQGHTDARRLDVAYMAFRDAYPEARRKGSFLIQQNYLAQAVAAGGPAALIGALRNHIASEQWRNPKHVPGMDTWLSEERWRQVLPPPATATTSGTVSKEPEWARAAREMPPAERDRIRAEARAADRARLA